MNPLVMGFWYWSVVLWQFCESAIPHRTSIKVVHKCFARNQAKDVCSILESLSSVAVGIFGNLWIILWQKRKKAFQGFPFWVSFSESETIYSPLCLMQLRSFFYYLFFKCDHCKHSNDNSTDKIIAICWFRGTLLPTQMTMCILMFNFLIHTYLHSEFTTANVQIYIWSNVFG